MARSTTSDWMSHLPLVLLGIRSSVREDSGTSPAELLYGSVLRLPDQLLPGIGHDDQSPSSAFVQDLREKMKQSVQMPVVYHGQQHPHLPASLASASHVFVRIDAVRPLLSRPYEGPFTVLSKCPDLKTFTVDRSGRPWVVSVDRLKPAVSLGASSSSPSPPGLPDRSDLFDHPETPAALPAAEDIPVPPPVAVHTRSGRVSRPPDRFQAGQ